MTSTFQERLAEHLAQLAEQLADDGWTEESAQLEVVARSLEQETTPGERPPVRLKAADAIDSERLTQLASLYAERGEESAALDCLELAKRKTPHHAPVYKIAGRLLLQRREWQQAAEALRTAQRYNPFDRETADLLARAEYELMDFVAALQANIDAFLLLRDDHSPEAGRLRMRIRTLKRALRWQGRDLVGLFRERRARLMDTFDRLQWEHDQLLGGRGPLGNTTMLDAAPQRDTRARLDLARRLQQIEMWSHLPDEALFHLTRAVHEVQLTADAKLFTYGDAGRDLYFLEEGALELERPTPYGRFVLHRVAPGELLGEINFVSPGGRTTTARTGANSRLLCIDADALDALIEEQAALGVQLYSRFWHSLAQKLRMANSRLVSLYTNLYGERAPESRRDTQATERSEQVEVTLDEKVNVLREQGLSRSDLLTLATFSRELRFPSGNYVFREGDPGREMYVVLEGRVRISRIFPDGGEEALAVFGRGAFFGEIALIDGQPRSADARAHEGPATVLVLDQSTISEVLSMDPAAALDFLRLLLRLLASRLREIDEKLVMWRILTGPEAP